MKCRGTEIRKKIVQEYYVEPVAHLKLLAGQTKHSDAEATIEDEYYIFIATRKKDGNKEKIICGMGAARDFLRLLRHNGLPLFNPLKEENLYKATNNFKPSGVEKDNEWNPVAKQLYNAIMLLITICKLDRLNSPLFNLKKEVEQCKSIAPHVGKIKSLNTIIKKCCDGKKLTEIVDNCRRYNNLKDDMCNFDLLKNIINGMTDKSGDKIESYI